MKPAWPLRPSASTAATAAPRHSGFTLLELLVVFIVIVAFLYLYLPAIRRPRPNHPARCLYNLKQMNLAWLMYSGDSGDRLVTNLPYASSSPLPTNNWMTGVMGWTANSQTTNRDLLVAGRLGPYLKNPEVYRCPDDKSESAAGPRVRSYAMNGFMGNGGSESAFTGWKQCLKTADVLRPAYLFVFADEHANSIDDGFFINNPNQTNAWTDLPASNHGLGAAGFGFADGHAEIHRWVDPSTLQPTKKSGPKPKVQLDHRGADLAWILSATAAEVLPSVPAAEATPPGFRTPSGGGGASTNEPSR